MGHLTKIANHLVNSLERGKNKELLQELFDGMPRLFRKVIVYSREYKFAYLLNFSWNEKSYFELEVKGDKCGYLLFHCKNCLSDSIETF